MPSQSDDVFDQLERVKFLVMTLRTMALLAAWSILASSGCCFAQEQEEDFPDSVLTSEQWQQRVQEARRRSEEYVAKARTQPADPLPSEKEDAEAADHRAMNDPSLQRGDIIATSQGFFVFVGRDDSEQRQPSDFVPAPSRRSPP
jgi:hypothetical protein